MKFNVIRHRGEWTVWWASKLNQSKITEESELIHFCKIHLFNRFSVLKKKECKLYVYEIRFHSQQELNWFLLRWG